MNVVILEGHPYKSEVRFWNMLSQYVLIENTTIRGVSGFSNIPRELDKILLECKDEYRKKSGGVSNILICYDTPVLKSQSSWLEHTVGKLVRRAKREIELNFHMLDYYCFEDCFLMFDSFLDWLLSPRRKNNLSEETIKVYEQYLRLNNNNIYLCWANGMELNEWVHNNMHSRTGDYTDITREQVSAELLSHLTRDTFFKTSKGTLGKCWYNDCFDKNSCKLNNLVMHVDSNGKEIPQEKADKRFLEIECGLFFNKKDTVQKLTEITHSFILNSLYDLGWVRQFQ